MPADFDVCVIGSGAGGGPVAADLAARGHHVVVLEKGPHLTEADFVAKDELAVVRRGAYLPDPRREPHVVETRDGGNWRARPTHETDWSFWNGSLVGGATNLMSGFFHRMKPVDFRVLSRFGPIAGGELADWPIGYDDLEPWYALTERRIGVSGRLVEHPFADRRSTPALPQPPLSEHPLARWVDGAGAKLGLHPFPVPRAVLSRPLRSGGVERRGACDYSGYCGLYGCATGAKGSSRAALLDDAVATGRCVIRAGATAHRLVTDTKGRITHVEYSTKAGPQHLDARVYVVACQAIESARLLLVSTGPRFPNGLANGSGRVGRHLLFSASGWDFGDYPLDAFAPPQRRDLRSQAPFVNRALQDWYVLRAQDGTESKGGTVEVMRPHPNPISAASARGKAGDELIWGWELKRRLQHYFGRSRHVKLEVFADWVPTPDCRVTLDPVVRDRWAVPSARVRVERHPENGRVASRLVEHGLDLLRETGAHDVRGDGSGNASTNLVGWTCRFGTDPATSVLDRDCRAHEVDNLYVTDGSFMPTGGSVPFTFIIYANAFRVAERIDAAL